MFKYTEIILHGKVKYEIVYIEGGKHVAYLNNKQETITLVRLLNKK